MNTLQRNQRGSLLVEVLLALAIAGLLSVAIGKLASANGRLIVSARRETIAVAYAKESMEKIVAARNAEWHGLNIVPPHEYYRIRLDANRFFLVPDPQGGEDLSDGFRRSIRMTEGRRDATGRLTDDPTATIDPEVRRIEVTVSWTEYHLPKERRLIQYLTHWQ